MKSAEGHVYEVKVSAGEIDEMSRKYAISNLKKMEDGIKLRIVSDERPSESAVETEPTLEDVYLYYFSEEVDRNEHILL